ncbi:hypothetical protein [Methanobacterium formicicum]|uniref:thymine-DNA glycosylase n=1 Tax=Methanobacterium formicicum TaxID=2162 RepID=A0A843AJ07_METFO|nr:hypothetical protein [Methanobacterium formicicum]MBF4473928.1 hypothetical protein [Methanobacterium formicicum]
MDKIAHIFVETIIKWWKNEKRWFPWRYTEEPYFILVTEVLLRKTTAKQVNSLYNEFFTEYPTFKSLSCANRDKLKKLIAPLGLSNQRSGQLIKLSKVILEEHGGKVPSDYSKLLNLPGVGRYAAGAVMCQCYMQDEAMVDRNVIRVIGRYFNFKSDKKDPSTDLKLWDFTKYLIPIGKCKEFNLGVMDFANAICRAKNPKCSECLLSEFCEYNQEN